MSAKTKPVCPVCQTSINEEDGLKVCAQCQSSHHIHCWDKNGGCAVEGCGCKHIEPGVSKVVEATKECHYCSKTVSESAVRCKHCFADLRLPIIRPESEESVTEETMNRATDTIIAIEHTSLKQIFSLSILKNVFQLTLENFMVLVVAQIIIFLATILGITIASGLAYDFPPIAFFFEVATYVFLVLMVTGYARVALDLIDGRRISHETFFATSERLPNYFAVSILLVILMFLGFNLFIIPGFIIAFLFLFTPFVMVDEKHSIMETIKISLRLVFNNFSLVVTWLLLMIVLNLVGFLALGFGIFVTLSLTLLMCAHFYREIN